MSLHNLSKTKIEAKMKKPTPKAKPSKNEPSTYEIKRNKKVADKLEKNWQKDVAEISRGLYTDNFENIDDY